MTRAKRRNPSASRARAMKIAEQPYHLIWEYDGAMRGMRFPTWEVCEKYSKALIRCGLSPKLTAGSPCPYDGG